jgi:hypothetical protein
MITRHDNLEEALSRVKTHALGGATTIVLNRRWRRRFPRPKVPMLRLVPSHSAAQAAKRAPAVHRPARRAPGRLGESHAQHQVFLDLSARYVEHCRATGAAESPALRAAADHFRRERSLAALIAFADLLETLETGP